MKIKDLALRLFMGKDWEEYALRNLVEGDGLFLGEGIANGCYADDVNDIAYYAATLTRKLLVEKGFQNTIHAYIEKHVLLGTEISELADAVKKGKGDQEEGEELADIVIRACNFLCCDEMWSMYSSAFSPESHIDCEDIVQVVVPTHNASTEIDKKYAIISVMNDSLSAIKRDAAIIATSNTRGTRISHMSALISEVYELIALCMLYSKMFLPLNLQLYIQDKMRYNFDRPYQYNTCKEFNK